MLDFLDKLRAKPEYIRRRIAFIVSTTLSLIVLGIAWSSWSLPPPTEAPANVPSPMDAVRRMGGEITSGFKEKWSGMMAGIQYSAEDLSPEETATLVNLRNEIVGTDTPLLLDEKTGEILPLSRENPDAEGTIQ